MYKRQLHACAGIVVSASHNPYYDNGIKFFSRDGQKLPDAVEMRIEDLLEQPMTTVEPDALGKAERIVDAAGRYIEFCKSTVPAYTSLAGIKIVVDCAHGATYHIAPSVLSEMGATVISIGAAPDGLNINLDCGSTKPAMLLATVKEPVSYTHLDVYKRQGLWLDPADGDRRARLHSLSATRRWRHSHRIRAGRN